MSNIFVTVTHLHFRSLINCVWKGSGARRTRYTRGTQNTPRILRTPKLFGVLGIWKIV